jgi:hypothetical protein
MSHRDDFKPGDLAVRLSFARALGFRSDRPAVSPRLEILDQTSGSTIEIELTAEQLTEMLSGGSADVTADKVTGFKGLGRWGKFQKTISRTVPGQPNDYKFRDHPENLSHVMAAVEQIEADGYVCDTPRLNNARQWVIFGRRYDGQPNEEN